MHCHSQQSQSQQSHQMQGAHLKQPDSQLPSQQQMVVNSQPSQDNNKSRTLTKHYLPIAPKSPKVPISRAPFGSCLTTRLPQSGPFAQNVSRPQNVSRQLFPTNQVHPVVKLYLWRASSNHPPNPNNK